MNWVDPTGEVGIPGMAIGAVSGFAGGFITGGWQGAAIGAVVGGGIGLIAPNASYTAASMATQALLGMTSNILGQAAGSGMADRPCGQSTFDHLKANFNGWSVLGSGVAGIFTPLWGSIASGSVIAEGAMTGATTGYFETAFPLIGESLPHIIK